MKVLDVGCGNNKTKEAIGIDISPNTQADIIHNLNKFPYPFNNNEFDKIICNDILEHLDNVITVMEELYRIAKPNAIIKIRVPHFSDNNAYGDLTHKHFFNTQSFDYFTMDKFQHRYSTKIKLKKLNTKIYFPKLYKWIEFLANWWPKKYERYFAFIFSAGNIEFQFMVVK